MIKKIIIVITMFFMCFIVLVICKKYWEQIHDYVQINKKYKNPKSNISEGSFWGRKGEKIKISIKTKIKSGKIKCILLDSKGNLIKDMGVFNTIMEEIYLPENGEYKFCVEFKDYVGSIRCRVYSTNEIVLILK